MVGIIGGSGSGKSWLAGKVARALGHNTTVICQDSFYKDLSSLAPEARAAVNFDHPEALDWGAFRKALTHLASGRAARIPCYDFATHTRLAHDEAVEPSRVVIVEGLWLLHKPAVRRFFGLSVYLDATSDLCLKRRIARDVSERGRAESEVAQWYGERVLPMQQRFVEPQVWAADCVICAPPRESEVAELAKRISMMVGGRI